MATSESDPVEAEDELSGLISSILDDCLYNIMSDAVLQVHREEKIARMDTAAILASQGIDAEEEEEDGEEEEGNTMSNEDVSALIKTPAPKATVTVDGKHYLKYNPLRTIRQNHCTSCRLPIFQEPYIIPLDSAVCNRRSYQPNPNPSPEGYKYVHLTEVTVRRTKSYKNLRTFSPPDSPSTRASDSVVKHKGGKDFSVPSAQCPNCPRRVGVGRMAQHLDKCLGLSGRRSGRDVRGHQTPTKKIKLKLILTPQKRQRQRSPESEDERLERKKGTKRFVDSDEDGDESWEDISKRKSKRVKSTAVRKKTGGKTVPQSRGSIKTIPGCRSAKAASDLSSQLDEIDSGDTLR